jgi:TIR domain
MGGDTVSHVGEPFVHDVFVSYSHGDAEGTGESRLQRWSQAFARELESELKAIPAFGAVRVFLDQHPRPSCGIDPLEPLIAQLRTDIESSALLMVLMSPQYLASRWCTQERDWWCATHRQTGLDEGRIAVVRIWQTKDPWPANLTDSGKEQLPGFFFYDRSLPELQQRPFGWPEPAVTNEPFQKALVEIVGRVALKLGEIRSRLEQEQKAREAAERLAGAGGQVIYLHGRAESTREWEDAFTTLQSNGLVVLPNDPDPVVSDPHGMQEISRHRVEIMARCDALLLVADRDARATDADLIVVGKHDRNSARAISNQLLPCALLDVVGPTISTPRRKGTARNLNVEWIDATQPTWPPAVQAWLLGASQDGSGR